MSKKFASEDDIEKKEQEIEALLNKVLRSPIGEYKDEREKLEKIFNKIQEISTIFGDRLSAVPDTVQSAVEKLRKKIEASLEDSVDELAEKVNNIHDSKIVILDRYLKDFNIFLQKNPNQIKEINSTLKKDISFLFSEKTKQFSEQMDQLSHVHEVTEAKLQILFEALQGDFCQLAEQGQKKYLELLRSFDQHSQSNKDLFSKVVNEAEKVPEFAAQRFKEVIDGCQLYLKNLINQHIDQVEQTTRRTVTIQEEIRIILQKNTNNTKEILDNEFNIFMVSLENFQKSLVNIENNDNLILSKIKVVDENNKKEISILKNEIKDVYRNARSHKMVLMVLLILTLFVTCGDSVLELLKFFRH